MRPQTSFPTANDNSSASQVPFRQTYCENLTRVLLLFATDETNVRRISAIGEALIEFAGSELAFGLISIGAAVGTLGTLVGAGGGFLLVPILLLLFPTAAATQVTAISLAVVLCNALVGSIAYGRMHRIHWRSGLQFALAAAPGAILGIFLTQRLDRQVFDVIAGITLIALAIYLLQRLLRPTNKPTKSSAITAAIATGAPLDPRSQILGISLSAFIGIFASTLGIGGGVFHVPMLIALLSFPIHTATATSQFVLAWTSLVAVAGHWLQHGYVNLWPTTAALAIGAIIGAPFGAYISRRTQGSRIVVLLALMQIALGLRLLWKTLP